MLSKLLHIVAVAACLTPAWGRATSELSLIRQPSTVYIVDSGAFATLSRWVAVVREWPCREG